MGVAKRALSLSEAIFNLIDQEMAVAAATLARPHLDTLLRLHSLWLVENPSEHVSAIMAGERLDRRKDRSGKKLTDQYLVQSLAKQEGLEWVANVYETTNGFVHLSNRAIFQAFKEKIEEQERAFRLEISPRHKASIEEETEMKAFVVEVNTQIATRLEYCCALKSQSK
ncbi:MAG: hypothetical protein ACRCTD_01535 [Beijerinckiaceae bacterium]